MSGQARRRKRVSAVWTRSAGSVLRGEREGCVRRWVLPPAPIIAWGHVAFKATTHMRIVLRSRYTRVWGGEGRRANREEDGECRGEGRAGQCEHPCEQAGGGKALRLGGVLRTRGRGGAASDGAWQRDGWWRPALETRRRGGHREEGGGVRGQSTSNSPTPFPGFLLWLPCRCGVVREPDKVCLRAEMISSPRGEDLASTRPSSRFSASIIREAGDERGQWGKGGVGVPLARSRS